MPLNVPARGAAIELCRGVQIGDRETSPQRAPEAAPVGVGRTPLPPKREIIVENKTEKLMKILLSGENSYNKPFIYLFKTLCAYKHYSINSHRKYYLKHEHTRVTCKGRWH